MRIRRTLFRFSLFAMFLLLSGCADEGASKPLVQASPDAPVVRPQLVSLAQVEATQASPVTIEILAANHPIEAGREFQLQLRLDVKSPWEISAIDALPPHQPTRIESVLPDGFELRGDWQSPEPMTSSRPDGGRVYSNRVLFQNVLMCREAVAAGEYELIWKITTQACDDIRCLRPTVSELKTVVKVVRNAELSSNQPLEGQSCD